jgi:hypothetical protein
MDSPVSSNLFTFKKAKRLDIASLSITYNPRSEDETFINGALYLEGDKKMVEKIIPKKKTRVYDFDYQKFWTERYKKLLTGS